ncbi:hypothetical protein EV191_103204 [Tamaricihabitans halophyticus]|uniref:PE family protein n=1 Tax=Tamaricihabitans halophyticus TaxID=1262583 RepID=A0A4R2QVR5_9PSEU|nr:hypothetical protein [Tamaricihabitans halophyticus]TCP54163.1 hypothetical protein EV191_103204 [Tamaricihabitans halophyticus]
MTAPDAGGAAGPVNEAGIMQNIKDISSSMQGFAQAAAEGKFAVNETGGQALINALDRVEQGLAEALQDVDLITMEPAIGDTPVAKVLKPFMQETAIGTEQSFLPNIKKFQEEVIPQAREAIKKAMENYQSSDSDNAQGLGGQEV